MQIPETQIDIEQIIYQYTDYLQYTKKHYYCTPGYLNNNRCTDV